MAEIVEIKLIHYGGMGFEEQKDIYVIRTKNQSFVQILRFKNGTKKSKKIKLDSVKASEIIRYLNQTDYYNQLRHQIHNNFSFFIDADSCSIDFRFCQNDKMSCWTEKYELSMGKLELLDQLLDRIIDEFDLKDIVYND